MTHICSAITVKEIENNREHRSFTCRSDELEHLFNREFIVQSPSQTIILQGLDPLTCFTMIKIGWQNGWPVTILKPGLTIPPNIPFVHSCIHITSAISPGQPDTLPKDCSYVTEQFYPWKEVECASILFTSGSTGTPKGVCHTFNNLFRSATLFATHFQLSSDDHLYCLAPVYSMSGIRCLLMPYVTSAAITFHLPEQDSFLEIIGQIQIHRPTKVMCGPVFVRQVAVYGKRLSRHLESVDTLISAGAELAISDGDKIAEDLNIEVLNNYGLTETAGLALADKPGHRSRTNFPLPCENVHIELVPTDIDSEIYQLQIASDSLFIGYAGKPLTRHKTFMTGDLVQKDQNDALTFVGRLDKAFKAPSTTWLFPELLETWLKGNPTISDAVVKGVCVPGGHGCEVWIEIIKPFYQEEIEMLIVHELGIEYQPIAWHYCSMQRNALGKIVSIDETK